MFYYTFTAAWLNRLVWPLGPGPPERGPAGRRPASAAAWARQERTPTRTQTGEIAAGRADARGGAHGHDREHRAARVPPPPEGEGGPEELARRPVEGRTQLALVDDPQYGLGGTERQGALRFSSADEGDLTDAVVIVFGSIILPLRFSLRVWSSNLANPSAWSNHISTVPRRHCRPRRGWNSTESFNFPSQHHTKFFRVSRDLIPIFSVCSVFSDPRHSLILSTAPSDEMLIYDPDSDLD